MKDNEIMILTEEGNKKFTIDYTFDDEETGNEYVMLYNPEDDDETYILRLNQDAEKVEVIEDDKEWDRVVKIVDKIEEDIEKAYQESMQKENN
jgi:uncharacterized protein YrzB (UPF0473 family)